MKGIRAERELVNLLKSYGIVAIRIPASGASRKDVLPDIIAGYRGKIAFFEVKHAVRIYISKQRLEELKEVAERFGARAFVVFRPKNTSDYYVIPVEDSPTTITKEKAKRFDHISRFIRRYFLGKSDVTEMI